MGFNIGSLFTGTEQSRFAAIAIIVAVIAIVLSILFSNTDLNIGDRVGLSVFVILFSLPSILFALFDLTCISGNTKYQSACWYYGWFLTIFIAIMSTIVVMNAFMSMIAYSDATVKSDSSSITKDDAENMAKNMMQDEPIKNEDKSAEIDTNMVPTDVTGLDNQYGSLMEGFASGSKKKKIEGFMDGGEYSNAYFGSFS